MSRLAAGVAVLVAVTISMAGCVLLPPVLPEKLPHDADDVVELDDVGFFPQEDYQCGPAALATILDHAGVVVTADDLTNEVFLPGRRGSLQLELLAATRRHGRVPYRVSGGLSELLAHLESGYPVVVLLNLAFESLPLWHYAVVVGYAGRDDHFILRSGTTRRKIVSARRFLDQWLDGGQWALLALRPGDIPPAASASQYVLEVSALEETGHLAEARRAYSAAVERWPRYSTARLGLANTLYASGELAEAEEALRRLLAIDPEHAAARNNLAHVLMEKGCPREAREVIRPVLADARVPRQVANEIRQTWSEIETRGESASEAHCAD